jgi:hypothetical protein
MKMRVKEGSVLGKGRQKDQECKDSLGYPVRTCQKRGKRERGVRERKRERERERERGEGEREIGRGGEEREREREKERNKENSSIFLMNIDPIIFNKIFVK